jgi:hypothetical protein
VGVKIRVLGGGWYGSHLALALLRDGHDVELHEIASRMFAGASGACPARLHQGMHYPRSRLTRAACQDHAAEFMGAYGHLTRPVHTNIYAVADRDSLVDFGTYCQVLRGEVEFIKIHDPAEFGLQNVEGAILTGERYISIPAAAEHFLTVLGEAVKFNTPANEVDSKEWDWTIDCTFCANDAENIDRYEPCVTGLVSGLDERTAITIMDGPFPSLYPWGGDVDYWGLHSVTSASLTPLSKTCKTWDEAKEILDRTPADEFEGRAEEMLKQMAHFYPAAKGPWVRVRDALTAIRAMPRSGADARLVDVVRVGERALRVRAGKIDAVFHAERIVREMLCSQLPVTAPQSSGNSPNSSASRLAA